MRWTVERLRVLLVALAVLVVAAILAALGYMRWQTRHIARDLPARLGVQIQQSSEGFTFSKTEQGRTVFTLHAANALQYRAGGHAVLHDVRIQIFDPKDGSSNTVAGDQFEYDPQTGIVRSAGEAHLELHATSGTGAASAQHTVHAVTHDLVFNQKTDQAVAGGLVAFDLPQGQGQAVGAIYDGKKNQLLLQSKVALHVHTQRGWAWIHAARALYDQQGSQVQLQNAQYAGAAEHASAQAATLLLRADNSLENIHARGQVRYRNASGAAVSAESMVAALDAESRPQAAHFAGDVQMDMRQKQQNTHAIAQQAQWNFDSTGHLQQAVLEHNVHVQQKITGAAPLARAMNAQQLTLDFATGHDGHAQLLRAVAAGDAEMQQSSAAGHLAQQKSSAQAADDWTLRGQHLTAQFAGGNQLTRLDGAGSTEVRSVAADGTVNSSTGDTLTALFSAQSPTARPAAQAGMNFDASTLQSAVQLGHVVLRSIPGTSAGQPKGQMHASPATVTAAQAVYAAAAQRLTLMGNPHYEDAAMEMVAQTMQWNRATGEMTATDSVQATLLGSAQRDGLLRSAKAPSTGADTATHIVADHALLRQPQQEADFSGHVRLWQGADVIEAPTLIFLQAQQEIVASGAAGAAAVHGTFVQAQPPGAHASTAAMPVNVTGDRLLYSGAERKAHWAGAVTATLQTGQLQADAMDLYLEPEPAASDATKSSQAGVFAGQSSVERFVALGHVRLTQPGRQGTGEQIVYTASDGRFVLTGTQQQPPLLVDAAQGSLTGRELVFASEQNTVQILGGQQSTTAVTRVQK